MNVKDKHTSEKKAPVDYACIFARIMNNTKFSSPLLNKQLDIN